MDHHTDLQIGSRFLTAATLICFGFAVAAMVSLVYDRVRPEQIPNDHAGATSPGVRGAATPAPPHTIELTPAADTVTNQTHLVPLPDGRSIYVPVTIHPVTVNLDGSTFSEQFSDLATSLEDVAAAQRSISSADSRVARRAEQIASHQQHHLQQMETSLATLSHSVTELRSELDASGHQNAEMSARVVDKLVQQLRHRGVRVAQRDPHPETRFDAPPASPGPADARDKEPLFEFEDSEPPADHIDSEPDIDDILDVPVPPSESNEQPVVEPRNSESTQQSLESPAVPNNDAVRIEPQEVPGTVTDDEQPQEIPAIPESVDTRASGLSVIETDSEPIPPVTDQESSDTPAAVEASVALLPKIPQDTLSEEQDAVVFEQTLRFPLPPATDPLTELALRTTQETALQPAARSQTLPTPMTSVNKTPPQPATVEPQPPKLSDISRPRWLPKFIYGVNIGNFRWRSDTPVRRPTLSHHRTTRRQHSFGNHQSRSTLLTRQTATAVSNDRHNVVPVAVPEEPAGNARLAPIPRNSQQGNYVAEHSIHQMPRATNSVKNRTTALLSRIRPPAQQPPPLRSVEAPSMIQRVGAAVRRIGSERTVH